MKDFQRTELVLGKTFRFRTRRGGGGGLRSLPHAFAFQAYNCVHACTVTCGPSYTELTFFLFRPSIHLRGHGLLWQSIRLWPWIIQTPADHDGDNGIRLHDDGLDESVCTRYIVTSYVLVETVCIASLLKRK